MPATEVEGMADGLVWLEHVFTNPICFGQLGDEVQNESCLSTA